MKCYNCGMDLSEHDFCTSCGADVIIYKKIMHLSNRYYNEGLEKAKVRDLSGAAIALRQSLKCNKYNTQARNLLGLVYFEMGEAVDALSEWVLSKNFQEKNNIADDFLNRIQGNPTKWDAIRQTIKKFNIALGYCYQDGNDLAIIQLKSLLHTNQKLVKGHQLLALLYFTTKDYDKAERCLVKAKRIDNSNTLTLHLEQELLELRREEDEEAAAKGKKKKRTSKSNISSDAMVYKSGNETIIQRLNDGDGSFKGNSVLNLVIGLVIGLAVMWYLVLPARISAARAESNKGIAEVSDQLTEKSASMDELSRRIDELTEENSSLQGKVKALSGGDGAMDAADLLMNSAKQYMENPDSLIEVAEKLKGISPSFIEGEDGSAAFKNLYAYMHENVVVKASRELLESGIARIKSKNYKDAQDYLERSFLLDDTNAEALYNLANAYRDANELGKASETYREVVSLFPDTELARNAKQYVETGDDSAIEHSESNDNGESPAAGDVMNNEVQELDAATAALLLQQQLGAVQPENVVPEVTAEMPGESVPQE